MSGDEARLLFELSGIVEFKKNLYGPRTQGPAGCRDCIFFGRSVIDDADCRHFRDHAGMLKGAYAGVCAGVVWTKVKDGQS